MRKAYAIRALILNIVRHDDTRERVIGIAYSDHNPRNRNPEPMPFLTTRHIWPDGLVSKTSTSVVGRAMVLGGVRFELSDGRDAPGCGDHFMGFDDVVNSYLLTADVGDLPTVTIASGDTTVILALPDRSCWGIRQHKYYVQGREYRGAQSSFETAYRRAAQQDERMEWDRLNEAEMAIAEGIERTI